MCDEAWQCLASGAISTFDRKIVLEGVIAGGNLCELLPSNRNGRSVHMVVDLRHRKGNEIDDLTINRDFLDIRRGASRIVDKTARKRNIKHAIIAIRIRKHCDGVCYIVVGQPRVGWRVCASSCAAELVAVTS